ncbi:L,D-transpeptidase [Schaalia sp. 19OD2882]|uniref:L,D-transpeptidase family protein n=1 Tax=Schaalia sp. 19OD2882 TaxID=2794089 RepID=UPI001C1F12CD|nr:L,D-transpeptidase family protein [Schaalia sp. 19OD2882]QWW19298.1 L,D-transpeptidase [Schaalia sp. 19OD2882]
MNAKSTSRKVVVAAVLGGAFLVCGGGAAAYAYQYEGKALAGTTVAGTDVSGRTRDQIVAQVQSLADGITVTSDVAGTQSVAKLSDLGVTIDAGATADAALARNTGFVSRIEALVGRQDVPVSVSRDQKALDAYTEKLAASAGPAMKNATVTPGADGVFTVTESAPGKSVDTAALAAALDKAVSSLSAQSVSLEVKDVEPDITTAEAKAAADKANAMSAQEVSVTDGIETYTATAKDKAGWVTIAEKDGTLADPVVDKAKVKAWVEATAEKTNEEPRPGIDNVDASGKVLAKAFPGKDGLKVNNADKVADDLLTAIGAGKAFQGSFDYDKVPPTNETRPVLPGAEKYPYPAHAGEKWIDVDLTKNTLTAYEGLTAVHGPIPINHGSAGNETVTGIFHVYLKYEAQDMGCTPDWPYCAKDVPWVSYFTGSYALHGAPWVGEFGRGSVNGSHGCVNLPVDEAGWIYQWNEIGTPVVSHY